MQLGDSYVNLGLVARVVFHDKTSVTVHYAVGNPASTAFHSASATIQVGKLKELLDHPRSKEKFLPLNGGTEYLNLDWVRRAQYSQKKDEITVTLAGGETITYGGADTSELAMRFM
jgi:hypothetical protein